MPLSLTQIDHDDLCHGWRWHEGDTGKLVELVARVAMGQYRHVAQILEGLNVGAPKTKAEQAADAIEKMQVSANGDPYQRDGWIFQTISWIAANQTANGAILQIPHIYRAHKGYDGLQLELTVDQSAVQALIIFEDKATINARDTIRDEVWPGIAALERGERAGELAHEATAMLERQQHANPNLNIDDAIDKIIWNEARRYRVSVTVDDTHADDGKRKGLFKDYDAHAPGDVTRRRAETMHFSDLRQWMDNFANLVIVKVRELAADV
ncbi:hypothetical protein [Sphingomonas colocasiae]|uniref:Uncharacterized protein n=1 Tax=Sphingomonas colocasiae TaxID=1848973 RepID=A0ABS7PTH4_9SPHN|nr:hypothetical protein [Sphingomonas colocasiae]MBY8824284.1 hypothetical protein [Sphingomonas colocasiae]